MNLVCNFPIPPIAQHSRTQSQDSELKLRFSIFYGHHLHRTPSNAPEVCELPTALFPAPTYSSLCSVHAELRPQPPLSPQKPTTDAAQPPARSRAASRHQKTHAIRMHHHSAPPPRAPCPDQVRIASTTTSREPIIIKNYS